MMLLNFHVFSFNFGDGMELLKNMFKTNKRGIFMHKLIPKTIAACFDFLLLKRFTSGNNIFSVRAKVRQKHR